MSPEQKRLVPQSRGSNLGVATTGGHRLTLPEFKSLVSDGRFFTALFVKRTNGEIRLMNCRTGVKRHLAGGSLPYNPEDHNLLVVWDRGKRQYRTIPAENILMLKHHGKMYWRVPDGVYEEFTFRRGSDGAIIPETPHRHKSVRNVA